MRLARVMVVLLSPLLVLGCDQPMGASSAVSAAPAAVSMAAPAPIPYASPQVAPSEDRFANAAEAGWQRVAEVPVSTFSLHSDTASYNLARRLVREGIRPQPAMVRAEEFINAFRYDYPAAPRAETPFATLVSVHPAPWDAGRQLLHIGIRTHAIPKAERPPLNLVFLIDSSGSMQPPDRLPLVKQAIRQLLPRLTAADRVAIVTYAGDSRVALEPVPGNQREVIERALDGVGAAGGTYGAGGIVNAYEVARRNFDPRAVNRIILATDGDFNLGVTSPAALERLVTEQRGKGIYLTTVGVGLDNLTDRTLHALARAGNGISVYAGNAEDAWQALVEDFAGNVLPVADDVKLQVEFNPAAIAQYRLIGYETRQLRREDFANDRVDAGEIGADRSITAIYEIVPAGSARQPVPPLRYQAPTPGPGKPASELAFVQIRYKLPGQQASRLFTRAVTPADQRTSFEAAPAPARFAAAVAWYAQALRRSANVPADWEAMVRTAEAARGEDRDGRRAEFARMVRMTAGLPAQPAR